MKLNPNEYNPPVVFHPGETLEEKLQEMGMGPKEFAIRTGKPEKTVFAIIKGRSSITPEMAVQFEHVLKIPAHFWLRMQRSYDEYVARMQRIEILKASVSWARSFPLREMQKKGWLPDAKSIEEKTSALLEFFGFSSHTAWENYYFNQQLKVAFRISLAHTKEPFALSAWLRRGELQAAELNAATYSDQKFKNALDDIRKLMVQHPGDFFTQLQSICLKAGVKLVYTSCLPKAPINGSTRWLGDNTPLIQLTNRYKRNDVFWFTFFHEAGHILLHGKKDIFLENIDYSGLEPRKELEADEFAIKWTFSKQQQEELISNWPLTDNDILAYAERISTHPAMIIGRLQHHKLIPYSVGREFFQPVELE
jgi:HTH-type transcriptional regulator / antitoxin HigA